MFRKFRPAKPIDTSEKDEKPTMMNVCNSKECYVVIESLVLQCVKDINQDQTCLFIAEQNYNPTSQTFSISFLDKSLPIKNLNEQYSINKSYQLHLYLGVTSENNSVKLNSKGTVFTEGEPTLSLQSEVSSTEFEKEVNLQRLCKTYLYTLIGKFKVLNKIYNTQIQYEEKLRENDSGGSPTPSR